MSQPIKSITLSVLKILGYIVLVILIIIIFLILKARSDFRSSGLYDPVPQVNFNQATSSQK